MQKFEFGTKAETLQRLSQILKVGKVLPSVIVSTEKWQNEPSLVLTKITSAFGKAPLVVRSSSLSEDNHETTGAGKFTSILNVSPSHLTEAIEKVIQSYKTAEQQQVLIQPYLEKVKYCGVVFTRLLDSFAPYFLVNYALNDTEAVTSGKEAKQFIVSHTSEARLPEPWAKLLLAVKEVMDVTNNTALDIEFAVSDSNEIYILQTRRLYTSEKQKFSDEDYDAAQKTFVKRFNRFSKSLPHLAGERTILGDMPDWNPAEIVGDRPYSLAYSIYRFLITDDTWHKARTLLGYYDVSPGELMVSIGKKPYIDARLSFNSLTPAQLSTNLREKLVNFYLNKLEQDPSSQDKVEFEILWTCFNTSLENDLQQLSDSELSIEEAKELFNCLKSLTSNLLNNFDQHSKQAEQAVKGMHARRNLVLDNLLSKDSDTTEYFQSAHILLDSCKNNGALWFSVMARLAFVARSIFLALEKSSFLDKNRLDKFFESVSTVATDFCKQTDLSSTEFIDKFGHLRPGTYDICAPRYDQIYGSGAVKFSRTSFEPVTENLSDFSFTNQETSLINEALRKEGLDWDVSILKNFYDRSTKAREEIKFEFSRNLSDALEFIAIGGEKLGITREQLQFLHFRTILKFRNPEDTNNTSLKQSLLSEISKREKVRDIATTIPLPAVIMSADNFYFSEEISSRPNFITNKQVSGQIVFATTAKELVEKDISGKIVLIENADPGYDWIFSKGPLALITKYGGAASHMAIRCSEFKLPAAIGVGNLLYNEILKSEFVLLDGEKRTIKSH